QRSADITEVPLPHPGLRDEEFSDRSAKSCSAHGNDENGEGEQDQGWRREGNQSRSDRARRGYPWRSAQIPARLKGNGRSFASVLHGGGAGRWDGDAAAVQRGAGAR